MASHRLLLGITSLAAATLPSTLLGNEPPAPPEGSRPNILFAIADDWGWPHASAYGDAVVRTPTFDRLAREGVLFNQAFVAAPSCTPSRGSILTGQHHWRLGGAANLWSIFPDALATYPELLAEAGYITGRSGKGWGPGRMETKGREPAGDRYKNFETFLAARSIEAPFVYWLGSADPHRPYDKGSGAASGMDLSKVHLFGHFPDATAIRSDVADYYFEVQRFDALVGSALAQLAEIGELDNTIIVMTGDHGMPFPRCKANLYDSGARVPLAVRWGAKVKGERVLDDLVSLVDLAPTFLEAAGVPVPDDMTGRCLSTLLLSDEQGLVEPKRDHVLTGKERHVPCQEAPDRGGYPCRALRTQDYLYIRNSTPERWPAGTPHFEQATIPGVWLGDCDNGPTKTWLVENREKDEAHQRSWDWCFAKRPAEELYDLKKDPEQLHNVAGDPTYAEVQAKLAARLTERLRATEDPRVLQPEEADAFFTNHPYYGRGPRHPSTTGQ